MESTLRHRNERRNIFFWGRGIYLITPACTRECSADEMKEEETGGEFIKDGVGWGAAGVAGCDCTRCCGEKERTRRCGENDGLPGAARVPLHCL